MVGLRVPQIATWLWVAQLRHDAQDGAFGADCHRGSTSASRSVAILFETVENLEVHACVCILLFVCCLFLVSFLRSPVLRFSGHARLFGRDRRLDRGSDGTVTMFEAILAACGPAALLFG